MRHAKKTAAGLVAAGIAGAVAIAAPAEGYRAYVYRDPVGVLTYCYGETEDAAQMRGKRFSEPQCRALLVRRMAHYQQGNAACVTVYDDLPAPVQMAFNDFSYNLGNATFCNSTAAKLLRQGDIAGACAQISRFIYAKGRILPGLVKRRALERRACERGA